MRGKFIVYQFPASSTETGTCADHLWGRRLACQLTIAAKTKMADQPAKNSEAANKAAAPVPNNVAQTLAEIALRSDHIVKTHLAHQAKKLHEEHPDEIGVNKAFADLATRMMSDPYKLAEAGMKMWQSQFELWQSWVDRKSVV